MSVLPISSKSELQLFIKLPQILYRGRAGFVPPLIMEQNDLLKPSRNGTFRHAKIQYFLAWQNGQPKGRIAAIVDYIALETWKAKIGWFGAFDAVSDQHVVNALLEAARSWLSAQGMQTMRGPVTVSCHGESGLMISGQHEPPMIATPWHPSELDALVQEAGLTKAMDLMTYRVDLRRPIDAMSRIPEALRPQNGRLGNISISQLSKRQIAAQGETLRSLYNDGWADTYNFVPLQSYEMQALIRQLKPMLRAEHYVQINQDSQPIAMALVVPNIFDIAGDLGGSPSPIGWVKLASRLIQHRFTSARVILLGVSRKVRGTLMGSLMPSLAIAELIRRRDSLPYTHVELGWILETNTPMRNLVEQFEPSPNKVHRIYETSLTTPATPS